VKVDEGLNAMAIIHAQQSGNPAIYTRNYQANNGIIEYDIRAVNKVEMEEVVERLSEIIEKQQLAKEEGEYGVKAT
jgi:L-seryl-tRNA(Ser) seleniumtransferase